MQISEILKSRQLEAPEKTAKSERNFLNKQIDELHKSPQEKILRKIHNWKNYIAYLKTIKCKDSKEHQASFKKTKQFLKEHKSLWFFTSHIKTSDLYYIISQMKDCQNRGKSASAWFFSQTKVK